MNTISGKKPNFFWEAFGRIFFVLPGRPSYVQVETTNLCNFNCKMCQRSSLGVPYEHMNFELFKKIVSALSGVYEINLTGWGEPLLHPDISQMIKLCKDLGFKTDLTSNGSLLIGKMADSLIEAGLDRISFSIDKVSKSNSSGHSIINQIDNIKKFSTRTKKPIVTLQCTIHKNGLKNIKEVVDMAKEIGAEKVNLTRLDIRYDKSLIRPDEKEEREMALKAVAYGKDINVRVDFIPIATGKGIQRILYPFFKNFLHRRGRYCLKIFNQIYINMRGEFTPCCALPKYKIGEIGEKNLSKVWQNKAMVSFRKNHRKICGKCDVSQIKQQ